MAVFFYVVLAGFFSVVGCVSGVPVGDVCMMAGFLVVPGVMVLSGGAMVVGRVFKVVCCFPMVVGGFFRHVYPPKIVGVSGGY
jgi:hypothetical protein